MHDGASWSFPIIRHVVGLNTRRTNQGATRHAYAQERKEWALELEVMRRRYEIPIATGLRRVVITRYVAAPPPRKKQLGRAAAQLMDYANYVGGCKPLIDAMVTTKLLVDDDPAHLRDHYRQVISDYDEDFDKIEIEITEVHA